jgi:hypothetical protein
MGNAAKRYIAAKAAELGVPQSLLIDGVVTGLHHDLARMPEA